MWKDYIFSPKFAYVLTLTVLFVMGELVIITLLTVTLSILLVWGLGLSGVIFLHLSPGNQTKCAKRDYKPTEVFKDWSDERFKVSNNNKFQVI